MKRLILIISVLMFIVSHVSSQNNTSLSISYQHLQKSGNHGVGMGFKTNAWGNVMFLSDMNYFFQKYHGIFEDNFQKEYYNTYCALNLNLGYNVILSKNICLLPYTGVGVFLEQIEGYVSSQGASGGSGTGTGAPFNMSVDDNVTAPVVNIGILIEYYLSEHLFFSGGTKYQLDGYDGTYNDFPYLTLGIGYKL